MPDVLTALSIVLLVLLAGAHASARSALRRQARASLEDLDARWEELAGRQEEELASLRDETRLLRERLGELRDLRIQSLEEQDELRRELREERRKARGWDTIASRRRA